ncbi:MAG: CatB-related O-acetyltransferase [Proteobacteria bacterium]|nr:CatB-related O-acetyltransferase [Pseudomonadota bacterium]MBU1708867.1 CatB-related O-acetyltransferase [Pseudomonadota bacterium]
MIFKKRKKSLQERYPQYEFGRETYGHLQVHSWGEGATLKVGSFTSIAPGVQIFLGGEHRLDWVTTFPFNSFWAEAKNLFGHPKTKGDVLIGNDVWLGAESLIMSGVTIGDGAVIGARAVVTKDVPAYAVVAGNPAIVVKRRFDDKTIQRFLVVKWWGWSDSRIKEALPLLLNNDIENFLAFAE